MIFPKDKDVGEICQTLANERKIPMCLLFFVYPTTSIEELLVVVEAVNGLWEWGGRTVSPHPHAHSTHDFVVHPLT